MRISPRPRAHAQDSWPASCLIPTRSPEDSWKEGQETAGTAEHLWEYSAQGCGSRGQSGILLCVKRHHMEETVSYKMALEPKEIFTGPLSHKPKGTHLSDPQQGGLLEVEFFHFVFNFLLSP